MGTLSFVCIAERIVWVGLIERCSSSPNSKYMVTGQGASQGYRVLKPGDTCPTAAESAPARSLHVPV